MLMIDEFHKDWAIRYLREASSDLKVAEETPYEAPNSILEALRKGQLALYYILGEPPLIEGIVHAATITEIVMEDPVLKFLVELEKMILMVVSNFKGNEEAMIKRANELIALISEVVNLFLQTVNS